MSDDEYLDVDLGDLRVSEIEAIEEITGVPIEEAFTGGKPRGKALRAIGYVVKRRTNPDFTLEDAGNLRIRMADEDPTNAAD